MCHSIEMEILKTHFHPDVVDLNGKSIYKRLATRAIVTKSSKILLLHTKRYDDYSLPGGGIDQNESPVDGMVRELQEETGAKNITNIEPFGAYEEYRPWGRGGFDVQHMISYCYTCDADEPLGETKYESYEVKNGMTAVWIKIEEAIRHNTDIIKNSSKKGLSIERETFLLGLIKEHMLNK